MTAVSLHLRRIFIGSQRPTRFTGSFWPLALAIVFLFPLALKGQNYNAWTRGPHGSVNPFTGRLSMTIPQPGGQSQSVSVNPFTGGVSASMNQRNAFTGRMENRSFDVDPLGGYARSQQTRTSPWTGRPERESLDFNPWTGTTRTTTGESGPRWAPLPGVVGGRVLVP